VSRGDVHGKENVLVRVHDQCFTGEVLGSKRCDCREQLQESLKLIEKEGGVLIYLQQEGRGIGLPNKVAAYALQDLGLDTVDANLQLGLADEAREYDSVPQILDHLGVKSIRLITNNPYKVACLGGLGVEITERVGMSIPAGEHNLRYLRSKRDRMHHMLETSSLNLFAAGAGAGAGAAQPPRSSMLGRLFRRERQHRRIAADASAGVDVRAGVGGPAGVGTGIEGIKAALDERIAIGAKGGASSATTTSLEVSAPAPAPEEEKQQQQQQQEEEEEEDKGGEVHEVKAYVFGEESVRAAVAAVAAGDVVVVVDDEDRENEGDLIMAADRATPESIGFMVRYSSGVICVSLMQARLEELRLPPMVMNNEDPKGTAYSVSVDAHPRHGISTGISAKDRAITLRNLADPAYTAEDFTRPGHTFPLRCRPGGVLRRMGHTEASLDLSTLAGLSPGGVLAEVVNDDGSMMRLESPDGGLRHFAATHGLVLTSVQDIVAFRQRNPDGV